MIRVLVTASRLRLAKLLEKGLQLQVLSSRDPAIAISAPAAEAFLDCDSQRLSSRGA